jgi:uncharacterized membrane protein YfcA
MEWQQIGLIGLVGLIGGLLSGLLGIGGAIVIIPVLVLALGYSQQMAQGTALIMMVLPVGGLAAWQYYQKGFVDVKVAVIMALFFFVGGYFGARFATEISQDILKKIFGVGLIGIAVKILFFDK